MIKTNQVMLENFLKKISYKGGWTFNVSPAETRPHFVILILSDTQLNEKEEDSIIKQGMMFWKILPKKEYESVLEMETLLTEKIIEAVLEMEEMRAKSFFKIKGDL